MRNFVTNCLILFILAVGLSCGQQRIEENEGQKVVDAVDVKSDAEFSPTEDDLKCFHDSDCIAADVGCCFHEKRLAINKEKYLAARAKIRTQCRNLSKEFYEQQKEEEKQKGKTLEKRLCRAKGREAGVHFNPNERVECKKDLPRLNPKDRATDPKKYDDDEKIYNTTPGKCSFKS